MRIEGIPVIIRFKTPRYQCISGRVHYRIEGIPVIIRFKTSPPISVVSNSSPY